MSKFKTSFFSENESLSRLAADSDARPIDGSQTSPAIQEHHVDFGQSLKNVHTNIQGGADFSCSFC